MSRNIAFFGQNYIASSGIDSDAQAFLTATGITDATITTAINDLVVGMKNDNIWTKMKAVYPFVGGTATTHKYNLKDPQDTNAAFRITFSGTITHNSDGITPAVGSTTNTNLNVKTLTNNDTHMSFYNRTSTNNQNSQDIGTGQTTPRMSLFLNFLGINLYSDCYDTSGGRITGSNTNPLGFYIQTRTSSTDHRLFKNGSQFGITTNTNTVDITTLNDTIKIGMNPGSGFIRNCAFASIGSGLDTTESQNFSTLVVAFQTKLGRNV